MVLKKADEDLVLASVSEYIRQADRLVKEALIATGLAMRCCCIDTN